MISLDDLEEIQYSVLHKSISSSRAVTKLD